MLDTTVSLRRIVVGLLMVIISGVVGVRPSLAQPTRAASSFVTRSGTQVLLDGKPFRVSGSNIYWLGLDENVGGVNYPSLYRVNDALDTVVAMGGTVVRAHTLGVSVGCPKCMMPQRGQWNAEAWRHSDYAIYAARQRGLKLTIALTDEYRYYHGGRHTFTQWRGKDDGAFWTDPGVMSDFTQYIGTILMHTNQFTGLRYRDDPTIMAWETGNELNAPAAWTATIARYLKHLDPNHLVIDGNYGLNANSLTIPEVDIVSDHFYPMDTARLERDTRQAQAAQKAFLVGEYGWNEGDLGAFLRTIEQTGVAGDLFWSLFPHADDGRSFVAHQDGYTLHFPGDTDAMREAVAKLRAHAYAMRGQQPPNVGLVPITTPLNPSWPPIVWSGNDPAPPTWTPANTGSAVPTPVVPQGTFVSGVNLGGNDVTVNGQRWLSMAEALARGMQITGGITDRKSMTPTPSADGDTSAMLNSLVYAPKGDVSITLPLANGTYQVYVWAMENYGSNVRSWNLQLEGQTVGRDLGFLPLNTWTNYGPYAVTVQDGRLTLDLTKGSGSPMISGFAVYRQRDMPPPTSGQPTTEPTNVPPTPAATTTGNLLQNGGFEAGTLSPWETSGAITVDRANAQRGTFGLMLNGTGRIDQRIATTPGQSYDVAGYVRIKEQTQTPSWGGLRIQIVDRSWQELAASTPLTLANTARDRWVRMEARFVARTTESRLIFQNFSNGGFRAAADSFIVSTKPIPADSAGSTPTTTPTQPTRTPPAPTPAAPTPAPSVGSIRVEGRTHGIAPDDVWLAPWVRLTNMGSAPIPLKEITVRYWLINDGGAAQSYVCDAVPVGCTSGRFVALASPRSGADTYLELAWPTNTGILQPQQCTGEMQSHVNHQNWTPYHEQAHYSYGATDRWTVTSRMTVYRNGTLIAGQEPSGASAASPTAVPHRILMEWLGQGTILATYDTDDGGALRVSAVAIRMSPNP